MGKYVLHYKDEVVYEIEAESKDEAIAIGDNYWAERVTPLEIIEEKPSSRSRLEKINLYKKNNELLKANAEQKLQSEAQALIEQIRELKPRIDELIATGNACKENGIAMTGQEWGGHEGYDTHQFYTNSWSHLVGFVQNKDSEITFLGINAGGACGDWNFRTDGDRVFSSYGDKIKEPFIAHMKRFVDTFDEFETSFYAYVDKVIEKQQKSVEGVIAQAKDRVNETHFCVDDKDLDL